MLYTAVISLKYADGTEIIVDPDQTIPYLDQHFFFRCVFSLYLLMLSDL